MACHGKEPAIHRTRESLMSKEKRGTKRLCESCGKKFYDLGRDPIVCPSCDTPFVLEKPKPKPEVAPAAAKPAEKVEEKKEEVAETATKSSPDVEPEFVSLEDAAAEEGDDDVDDLADIDDDADDISTDDDGDVFLEDDEDDDGSDVTGIIGGPIDPKDEA